MQKKEEAGGENFLIWLSRAILAPAYAAVYVMLFFASPLIRPANSARVITAVLSVAAFAIAVRDGSAGRMKGYRTRGMRAAVAAICLYASFASFGYRLFLEGDFMYFSWDGLLSLALGAIWFYPVVLTILSLLERWGDRCASAELPAQGPPAWRVGLTAGLVALACISISFIAFFPGHFPVDPVDQILQVKTGDYDNWHPVVHTLLIQLALTVWDHPGFVVFAQLTLFAAMVGRVAVIPYRFGVKRWVIYLCAGIFALLPNQAMTNISPLKDFPFTYAMVWGTVLLLELALDLDRANRPGWLVQMLLCLYFIKELRHNGFLPCAFIAALLIVVSVKNWSRIRPTAIICVGLAVVLIAATEGPLFAALNVTPNALSPYVTMFCAVGSCLNKDLPLSDESMELLKTVMPLNEWKDNYGHFEGFDGYIIADNWQRKPMQLWHLSAREAFGIYFEALMKYPDVVIKDRLDGMNIMWDVTQPDDDDPSNIAYRFFDMIRYTPEIGLDAQPPNWGVHYRADNAVADFYRRLGFFSFRGEQVQDQVTDMLLWRTGAWLIYLLALMVYWIKNRMTRMWWAATPMLGNVLGMILALCHQSFRYVYFIQLTTIVLTLGTMCMCRRQRGEAAQANKERAEERSHA